MPNSTISNCAIVLLCIIRSTLNARITILKKIHASPIEYYFVIFCLLYLWFSSKRFQKVSHARQGPRSSFSFCLHLFSIVLFLSLFLWFSFLFLVAFFSPYCCKNWISNARNVCIYFPQNNKRLGTITILSLFLNFSILWLNLNRPLKTLILISTELERQ